MQRVRQLLLIAPLILLGTGGVAESQEPGRPGRAVPVETSAPTPAPPNGETPAPDVPSAAPPAWEPIAWGLIGLRGFVLGTQAAPNGVTFNPLFSLDFDFNLWLWKQQRVYAFSETRFWGQKAAPGITNASQGAFDFSKREFDLDLGAAWNYYGTLEARVFAYSQNNLNRGISLAQPHGFIDGVGLENRWYVGGSYPDLGVPGFDVARATFVSLGYYPTKNMVDVDGNTFKPGPFGRAYLTYDLFDLSCYLFGDVQLVATQACNPKLLLYDVGAAWRPFERLPFLEFRTGAAGIIDLSEHEQSNTFYGAVRVIF